MLSELKELYRYRELLIVMVQRDLRIRYKNSVLGFLWSFINPLVTTLVMTLVFGVLLGNGVKNYSAYVLSAYLPFMFFQMSVLDSCQSILVSLPVVKKVYFPREILPLAAILSNFINLLMGFLVFFLFLTFIYFKGVISGDQVVLPFQVTTVYLPLLLLISLCLSAGVGLLVSALNTFYEDVKYIVGVLMYLMLFLCPVMYFMEEVANSNRLKGHMIWFKLYNLNPLASLSTAYRKILLAPVSVPVRGGGVADPWPLSWNWIGYDFVFSIAILIFGYWVFNRMKWRFVERP